MERPLQSIVNIVTRCSPHCTTVLQYYSDCSLNAVQCTKYTVQCNMYSVQCILYTVQCILYNVNTVQCVMYTVQSNMYPVKNITCNVHCTLYFVYCTVNPVYSAVYSLHCILFTLKKRHTVNSCLPLFFFIMWVLSVTIDLCSQLLSCPATTIRYGPNS